MTQRILIAHYPQKPAMTARGKMYWPSGKTTPSHRPGDTVTRFDGRKYKVQPDGSLRRQ